jgi:hypothetical protein
MSVSITSTYAGEFSGKYIAAALLSADTLDKGGITVMPNVKFKSVLKKASTDAIVKDASCDFQTGQGTLTLTEKVLQPEEFQVNLDICKKDLHSDWEAAQMGFSAFDNLPANFSDFVLAHVAAKVANRTELNIWSGDTSTSGQFDGFSTLLAVDADLPAGNEVAGTTVTAANVDDELGKIVDAIPSAVYSKEDLHIYVSQNIYRAYVRYLGGQAATNGYDNKANNQVLTDLFFDGIKIFPTAGLADNTAIAAEKSNLFFGTGLLSDMNEVRVIDMADTDGSQNVRVVMRFTAGVQYAQVGDIVTYGITNTAN